MRDGKRVPYATRHNKSPVVGLLKGRGPAHMALHRVGHAAGEHHLKPDTLCALHLRNYSLHRAGRAKHHTGQYVLFRIPAKGIKGTKEVHLWQLCSA